MSTARDPRTDPRPGDVLGAYECDYKVATVDGDTVRADCSDGSEFVCCGGTWKVVMANARVVARGAGVGGTRDDSP